MTEARQHHTCQGARVGEKVKVRALTIHSEIGLLVGRSIFSDD